MALIIKNGIIVNADKKSDSPRDILIDKGKIIKIAPNIPVGKNKPVDGKGKFVLPGLIDTHVHLREPGREDKETIATGSRAAVKGGFTTVMCMPNTDPVADNAMIVEGIIKEARRVGLLRVIPVGAVTRGQRGNQLTDMFELKEAGCLALSDDGSTVANAKVMRLSLEYARMAGLLIVEHCQDSFASAGAVMNEGYNSTFLGMKGDPGFSETVMVARDIEIARYLNARIHFAHISLKRSVDIIRQAKADGVQVTCEVTPHHFTLTDDAVKTFDPNTKVNPPLRSAEDVQALKKALKDGAIDSIASDHAPHTQEDKEVGFDHAPFGMIGLETALGLAVSELVDKKVLTWPGIAEKMSASPARIFGLAGKGRVQEGADADIVIVDPDREWVVKKDDIASKSKNTPFIGRKLKGLVEATIYGGKIVYQNTLDL